MLLELQISSNQISEGSCDTEHWGSDAENSALQQQLYIAF